MVEWYPQNKEELNKSLDSFLNQKLTKKENNLKGIVVPHAGYEFSGKIAGKAFSMLKNLNSKKAIILSPSHYFPLEGTITSNQKSVQTPLGKIKIISSNFQKGDISKEHAINNQIPFLQKLGFSEILPLVIGEISQEQTKEIAEKISNFDGIFIISTDLSHFLPYEPAKIKDSQTIKAIASLNQNKLTENSACGIFPLLILIELCKIKKTSPHLIEYKNSGDVTENKESVVGYASFYF